MMFGAIDVNTGTDQCSRADDERRGVQKNSPRIDQDLLAEIDVEPIGAMERRLDADARGDGTEESGQRRGDVATLRRRRGVVLEGGIAGLGAKRFKLGVNAGVPVPRLHALALASAHTRPRFFIIASGDGSLPRKAL